MVTEHAGSVDCLTACSSMHVLAKFSVSGAQSWMVDSGVCACLPQPEPELLGAGLMSSWQSLVDLVESYAADINTVQFSKVIWAIATMHKLGVPLSTQSSLLRSVQAQCAKNGIVKQFDARAVSSALWSLAKTLSDDSSEVCVCHSNRMR